MTVAWNMGMRRFGHSGLTTSRLGFGTYRVDTREPEHRDALKKALREGVNLIDTSTNYMDGDSERLVGSALRELIKSGDLTREEVIVVSKIGYVQGHNLKQAEAREQAGHPYPDMVKYGEGIWHCIHPEYLADQLTLSLDRLGLTTLDVCLLHNPEYFLSEAAHHDGGNLAAARDAFIAGLNRPLHFSSRKWRQDEFVTMACRRIRSRQIHRMPMRLRSLACVMRRKLPLRHRE